MSTAALFACISTGAILGIWIGYPTVMMLLASMRRHQMPSTGSLPSLSVVIATREPSDAIARKVRSVLAAEYPPERFELIVALDPAAVPMDGVPGIEDARVRVLQCPGPPGKSSALNAGVAQALGEIVVLTDTHQLLHPGALIALARGFSHPSVGAVSGFLELKPGSKSSPIDAYWRLERQLRWAEGRISSSVGVTGALYAVRRSLWPTLPEGLILDDVYVPMSIVLGGHRVVVEQAAIALEQRYTTVELEFRRKARTLAGNLQLLQLQPAILDPSRNPIWLQFLLHKLARLLTPFLLLVMIVSVAALILGPSPSATRLWKLALPLIAICLLAATSRGRHQLRWIFYLQLATLLGVYYGLRQRSDVWR